MFEDIVYIANKTHFLFVSLQTYRIYKLINKKTKDENKTPNSDTYSHWVGWSLFVSFFSRFYFILFIFCPLLCPPFLLLFCTFYSLPPRLALPYCTLLFSFLLFLTLLYCNVPIVIYFDLPTKNHSGDGGHSPPILPKLYPRSATTPRGGTATTFTHGFVSTGRRSLTSAAFPFFGHSTGGWERGGIAVDFPPACPSRTNGT